MAATVGIAYAAGRHTVAPTAPVVRSTARAVKRTRFIGNIGLGEARVLLERNEHVVMRWAGRLLSAC